MPAPSPLITSPLITSALRTLKLEREGLIALEQALENGLGESFAAAVTLIQNAKGRMIVTGMGKSGHVGRKIAATLASTGTPAHFVHPSEASHGDLGMIQPDDVVLALSWSGETAELSDIVAYARRFRVGLIAVTSQAHSTLAREADVALVLPKAQEACPNGLAPTTSSLMQMALGDALAMALLEARGFSAEDFRDVHPGGKLGARLRQVGQIMHTRERLPLIASGSTMDQAILIQSEKGFGCVLVVDDAGLLQGIITDGDLRRHMAPHLLSKPVNEVMTLNPKTVTPDLLVAEALEIVETRKITALIVAQDQRPVGIVHILDLLRLGAV